MDLLEYYGFRRAGTNANGEYIYERKFSSAAVSPVEGKHPFDLARENYPRFIIDEKTRGFGIPIKEDYHDILFPDLWQPRQPDLFSGVSPAGMITRPGNTIRKVYLCRAQSNLGPPGSLLFFYKGVSKDSPSQAITVLGILESIALARSTKDLMQMTGGRSVYSEGQLDAWEATPEHTVKVINFLLVAYIAPPISKDELETIGVINGHPQQSIYELRHDLLIELVKRANLDFSV
jgi:hypothetical protein